MGAGTSAEGSEYSWEGTCLFLLMADLDPIRSSAPHRVPRDRQERSLCTEVSPENFWLCLFPKTILWLVPLGSWSGAEVGWMYSDCRHPGQFVSLHDLLPAASLFVEKEINSIAGSKSALWCLPVIRALNVSPGQCVSRHRVSCVFVFIKISLLIYIFSVWFLILVTHLAVPRDCSHWLWCSGIAPHGVWETGLPLSLEACALSFLSLDEIQLELAVR